jgi:outer membrane cobalamin receptor
MHSGANTADLREGVLGYNATPRPYGKIRGCHKENFRGPDFDIEDYSFVNFAGEYEINTHVSVFGRIDNLTNEHYAEVFGFPALGRAACGGMRLSF